MGSMLRGLGCLCLCLVAAPFGQGAFEGDYHQALTKTLLYFEAQRSGKLPATQRVQWRGDSALTDGNGTGLDLTKGYFDSGDNVKFGFPMAFTITMLSWSVVEFADELKAANEFWNALDAIRWGTDYLLEAHSDVNFLYAQVGDGNSDHQCWERPEDMDTPRTTYFIDQDHPGSDLAGETAAALAAAAMAFKDSDKDYASLLLTEATQVVS
ncbi:hypothetical protein AMTR_s00007p00147280 [Amborella trichopoda]|uniref:cellulase n=1 Tax=Amborella trichopoda TaxID=13333 RepID=W1PBI9_AMBTC|nr:hypothetical protein AMTR_s00007p00147280 [Amborella trichopoda]